MVDSTKDKVENQAEDSAQSSAYSDHSEMLFSDEENPQQLELELDKELDANDYETENEATDKMSFFMKGSSFFAQRKYLLAAVPVFFLALFLLASGRTHTGTIKTDGFTYEGQILNEAPNGKGTLTYANGDTYVGEFKAGKFSGAGIFAGKAGKWSFEGKFEDGLAVGKGIMTTPDGTKHEETYKNGVLAR